ncbi:MAG: tyrosine-type recombinase/integrase [Miltoncostaeaceae bacterium]
MTVRKYLDVVRSTLDYAGREGSDNPARSRHLRVGKQAREEINPPTFDHVQALLQTVTPRYRLHLTVLEATGLRISELLAITWGRMDFRSGGMLVAPGATKGNTSGRRFVELPDHVLDEIDALVPVEDRQHDKPVFSGSDSAIRNATARACKFAGIPHYSPHDFRHRWIGLRYAAGWPETNIAEGAGHGMKSVTREVYAHVLRDEPQWLLDGIKQQLRDGPVMAATTPISV